jgi:hypothetical protein
VKIFAGKAAASYRYAKLITSHQRRRQDRQQRSRSAGEDVFSPTMSTASPK